MKSDYKNKVKISKDGILFIDKDDENIQFKFKGNLGLGTRDNWKTEKKDGFLINYLNIK